MSWQTRSDRRTQRHDDLGIEGACSLLIDALVDLTLDILVPVLNRW